MDSVHTKGHTLIKEKSLGGVVSTLIKEKSLGGVVSTLIKVKCLGGKVVSPLDFG